MLVWDNIYVFKIILQSLPNMIAELQAMYCPLFFYIKYTHYIIVENLCDQAKRRIAKCAIFQFSLAKSALYSKMFLNFKENMFAYINMQFSKMFYTIHIYYAVFLEICKFPLCIGEDGLKAMHKRGRNWPFWLFSSYIQMKRETRYVNQLGFYAILWDLVCQLLI